MSATEIPRSNNVNPTGIILAPACERLTRDSGMNDRERRRLKTRVDNLQKTLDRWSPNPLVVFNS